MFTTTSIWVALPHGLTGPATDRRLRLAAAVSLRLASDSPATDAPDGAAVPLSSFPEVLDWAATVAGLQFTVEISGGATVPAQVVSTPDPPLWQALFPGSAPVRLHAGVDPLAHRPVSTFPNAALANQLSSGYPKVFSSSPIDPPAGHTLSQAFPELRAALAGASDEDMVRREQAALALEPAATDDQELLAAAQADLAAGLLGHSAAGSRTERLAAITRIAQRLAQLRGGAYTPVIPGGGDPVSAFTQLLAFHRGPRAMAAGQARHASQQSGPAGPAITGVNPGSGTGGDLVTITGSGFTGATAVYFGTSQAGNVQVVPTGTQITCTSPAAPEPGLVHITVTTPAGTSATSGADEFTYANYDVHQAFSMLADYPLLLPMLGLAVELELPLAAVPQAPLSASQPGLLRAHPVDASGAALPGAIAPWTAYTLDSDLIFVPAAKPGTAAETTAGLLNLAQQGTYEIVQIDADAAGAEDGGRARGYQRERNWPANAPDLGHLAQPPRQRAVAASPLRRRAHQ